MLTDRRWEEVVVVVVITPCFVNNNVRFVVGRKENDCTTQMPLARPNNPPPRLPDVNKTRDRIIRYVDDDKEHKQEKDRRRCCRRRR